MSTAEASLPIPHITFGDRLRRLRLDVGVTQSQFGDLIGLSAGTIAKYELMPEPPARPRVLRNLLELRYGAGIATWVLTGQAPSSDPGDGASTD